MSLKINRLILYASSFVGAYLSLILILVISSDITDLVPEIFIFILSLILIFLLFFVYSKIEWNDGVGSILGGWFIVLIFNIFFIQIPFLTPGSLALSGLPYTNIRTVDSSGFIERDEIVSSNSPEAERVRRTSIAHPRNRTDPYIERYFLSWRYGILLNKTQSLGDNYTTYNLYPDGFLDNIIYSVRTISETVFRFFLFTSLPFSLFIYYTEHKSGDRNLTDIKVNKLSSNLYLKFIIHTITIGLVILGGLSIFLSYP